jgi:hypothetical protein
MGKSGSAGLLKVEGLQNDRSSHHLYPLTLVKSSKLIAVEICEGCLNIGNTKRPLTCSLDDELIGG